jgi:hypothetical protein
MYLVHPEHPPSGPEAQRFGNPPSGPQVDHFPSGEWITFRAARPDLKRAPSEFHQAAFIEHGEPQFRPHFADAKKAKSP